MQKCHKFYGSGTFKKDSEGYDEYCRWCANGGDLLLCDFCQNGFCKVFRILFRVIIDIVADLKYPKYFVSGAGLLWFIYFDSYSNKKIFKKFIMGSMQFFF